MRSAVLAVFSAMALSLPEGPVWAAAQTEGAGGGIGLAAAPGGGVASLMQVTGALLLVVGGIIAVIWLLRRLSRVPAGGSGGLRVIAGLALGARERILLVEVGETHLLLGVTPGRLRTLHVLDKPVILSGGAGGKTVSFAERLGKVLQGG